MLVDRLQRSPDAVDLYRAARAARALGRYRQANALLRNAAGAAPDDPAIETLWGDLFGEKYDQAEASQSYIAALEIDEDAAGSCFLNHFMSTSRLGAKIERWISPVTVHLGFKSDLDLPAFLAQAGLEPVSIKDA